jgi:flavin reductase (DIM6/NTAB) family NADH-FMN oxidoreductase RutF
VKREEIPFKEFALPPVDSWAERWMLLAAGERSSGQFNIMTVAWGGIGFFWNKPLVVVAVRPNRYTYQFMEKYPTFSLSAFPRPYREKLMFCGTNSGRNVDKVKECGFTPIKLVHVGAPGFDEAELILECRKMYYDDFNPDHFLDRDIASNYSGNDYHRFYFGEILTIHGVRHYRCGP